MRTQTLFTHQRFPAHIRSLHFLPPFDPGWLHESRSGFCVTLGKRASLNPEVLRTAGALGKSTGPHCQMTVEAHPGTVCGSDRAQGLMTRKGTGPYTSQRGCLVLGNLYWKIMLSEIQYTFSRAKENVAIF